MADMIRTFEELTPGQQSSAGGTGGALAQLYQAGYPVPDGLVMLPTAFDGDEMLRVLKPGGHFILIAEMHQDGQEVGAQREPVLIAIWKKQ